MFSKNQYTFYQTTKIKELLFNSYSLPIMNTEHTNIVEQHFNIKTHNKNLTAIFFCLTLIPDKKKIIAFSSSNAVYLIIM